MYIPRWANSSIASKLNTFRIISVVGSRQSGKTTLLLNNLDSRENYKSLDDPILLQDAHDNPAHFVQRSNSAPLLIDEIQKELRLIGQIKYEVDMNPALGQYIISGSSDYRKLPHAIESLAGRAGFVRVRTFSEAEKRSMSPGVLNALFQKKLPTSTTIDCSKREVLNYVVNGGYPGLLYITTTESRTDWFNNYLDHQITLDMTEQWGKRNLTTMKNILQVAANHSSCEFRKNAVAKDFSLAWATLDSYWSALVAMFLVDMVPGWDKKAFNRPSISPKPFMTDSGLLAHLLNVKSADTILSNPELATTLGGKLVETWVYNQLMPEIDLHPTWDIYYFRSRNHEIDFLITDEYNNILGIEVKSGEGVSSSDATHLQWLKNQLGNSYNFTGIVLYCGDRVRTFADNCFALPMSVLWSDPSQW